MLTAERHRAILRLLAEQGSVTMAEIAERFKVSTATARRDAVLLAASGQAARSHGGLLPAKFFQEGPQPRPAASDDSQPKVRIARRACDLLPHEGNVFVDADDTCLEVGRLLLPRRELRLFTNSVRLLALAPESQAALAGIGGEVRGNSQAMTGPLARAWLGHLHFDLAVIGADGIDLPGGAYAAEAAEAAIKAEALARAAACVLVVEGSCWGRSSAVRFAPWSRFSSVVTDQRLPRPARVALAAEKVKVFLI